MLRSLVDEDLPRSLARELCAAGVEAEDVRDVGLRGRPDDEVFSHAVSRNLVLLTGDLGFGNVLRFPPGRHPGIGIVRYPNEIPTRVLNQAILDALKDLAEEEIRGNLLILEPGRIRLRRG